MDISPYFFYAFAGLAIAAALFVVLKENPVSSAFSLVLVFFAFAGIYALMNAHLIAALQIFVYAGAIMVLFVFVIMLLNADVPSFDMARSHIAVKVLSVVLGIVMMAMFIHVFQQNQTPVSHGAFTPEAIEAAGGNTKVLSELMFS